MGGSVKNQDKLSKAIARMARIGCWLAAHPPRYGCSVWLPQEEYDRIVEFAREFGSAGDRRFIDECREEGVE